MIREFRKIFLMCFVGFYMLIVPMCIGFGLGYQNFVDEQAWNKYIKIILLCTLNLGEMLVRYGDYEYN